MFACGAQLRVVISLCHSQRSARRSDPASGFARLFACIVKKAFLQTRKLFASTFQLRPLFHIPFTIAWQINCRFFSLIFLFAFVFFAVDLE
jgi:hypothetical protein